jgi:hypothetical protein
MMSIPLMLTIKATPTPHIDFVSIPVNNTLPNVSLTDDSYKETTKQFRIVDEHAYDHFNCDIQKNY